MLSVPSGTTILIIDTEQSSREFYRELCAYLTGRVGEDGVGEVYAQKYEQETGKEPLTIVADIMDNTGAFRPCAPWETPGWFNNGVGGFFKAGQESEAIAHYRRFTLQEKTNLLKQKKLILARLQAGAEILPNLSVAKTNLDISALETEIESTKTITRIPVSPALLSVAIFLNKEPSMLELDIMKVRALDFVDVRKLVEGNNIGTINITDFRLLKVRAIKQI